jgi:hypothetical protein
MTATVTCFPCSQVLGRGCHSCLLWPACLFTVHMRKCAPPLFRAQGALPSLLCLFLFSFNCLFIIQVFFPGQGSVCPEGYADLSQGVPHAIYLLTWWSPKQVGAGIWQHRYPLGFSIYHGMGMLCMGWRCGSVRVLSLLGGFSCQVYLQCLSKSLL